VVRDPLTVSICAKCVAPALPMREPDTVSVTQKWKVVGL